MKCTGNFVEMDSCTPALYTQGIQVQSRGSSEGLFVGEFLKSTLLVISNMRFPVWNKMWSCHLLAHRKSSCLAILFLPLPHSYLCWSYLDLFAFTLLLNQVLELLLLLLLNNHTPHWLEFQSCHLLATSSWRLQSPSILMNLCKLRGVNVNIGNLRGRPSSSLPLHLRIARKCHRRSSLITPPWAIRRKFRSSPLCPH